MLCHNKVTAGQAYPGLSPQDELKNKPEHLGRYGHSIHALGRLTDTTQNPEMTRSQPEAQLLLAHAGASGCRSRGTEPVVAHLHPWTWANGPSNRMEDEERALWGVWGRSF